MSLEAAILELVAAVKENTEELKFLTSAARDGATKNASRASTKPAEDGEKTSTRSRGGSRSTKEKVPSVKEISEATKAFLDVNEEDEYEDRKDIVKRIVEKFKAKKMSEIDDAHRAEAMRMLKIAQAGDDPFEGEGGKDEDDDLA